MSEVEGEGEDEGSGRRGACVWEAIVRARHALKGTHRPVRGRLGHN